MRRPSAPFPMEFFETERPAAGGRRFGLELGELRLEIRGLDDDLAASLDARCVPFSTPTPEGPDTLRVRLRLDDRDYFIAPPAESEFNPVLLACEGTRIRYLGYRVAGWFDTLGGSGEIVLARGTYEPAPRAIENYVRAAVAWQAVSRGGALVHAASAIRKGRGYLFYGESGAGKSTLSAADTRGVVVSDDLSLVLPGERGPDLVGSPFRGTYEGGERVKGRTPLVAGFRIIQDIRADVRPVPRTIALAELVGNLPFVAEAFGSRPDLFAKVESSFSTIPLAHLHFRKDDSYWDAVEQAGL